MNKSELMGMYNRARGSKARNIDPGRLNRAFGLLQRKDQEWRGKYNTTINSCGCPDHAKNGRTIVCKHRLALMIEFRIVQRRNKLEAEKALAALALDNQVEKLRKTIWNNRPYGTYSQLKKEHGWKNIVEEKAVLETYLAEAI